MSYTLEIPTWMDLGEKKTPKLIQHVVGSCFHMILPVSLILLGFAVTFLPHYSQEYFTVTWLKLSVESRWNVEANFESSCLFRKQIYLYRFPIF